MLGRTVVFALVLILATVTVAWIADRKVGSAAHINTTNQSERVRITHGVRELSNLLWETETQFQRYMIEPHAPLQIVITSAVDDMIQRGDVLNRQPWVVQNDEIRQATQQLLDGLGGLKSKLAAIMDIRADPLKVFPAMRLMVTQLNPLSTEFISTATLGMQEAEDYADNPDQQRIGLVFRDLRYVWSQRINTFRLFAASRVGMFSTSVESSVSAATQDIDIFGQQLRLHLDQLRVFEAQHKLGLQQSEALSVLGRILKA